MQYTPFGEFFRILRIKNHEVLNDAKAFLGVSVAYISSVECGRKPIPEGWAEKIIAHYNLLDDEIAQLNNAIEQTKTCVKLNLETKSVTQRKMAFSLGRSFDDIDDQTAQVIIDILERKNNGL